MARSAVAIVLLGACADSVAPKGPVVNALATGGSGQSAYTLDTLPEHLVVRLVNDAGTPLAGQPVTWSSADETFRIVPVDPVTTASGHARALVVLGFNPGRHVVTALAAGFDEVAEFELTAHPRPGFKAIALMRGLSWGHMCALGVDSLAWCWGDNRFGQLGDGTTVSSDIPRQVAGNIRFRSIAGTGDATCALTAAGALWCWGLNHVSSAGNAGMFGNGSLAPSLVPVPGASGLTLAQFDMEPGVACGVTTDARGYCWGSGWLGSGDFAGPSNLPLEVAGGIRWREIAPGDDRRCGIAESWRVYCWTTSRISSEEWPEWIGVDSDAGPMNTPLPVDVLIGGTGLSVSIWNQCAISVDGAATGVCWGWDYLGNPVLDPPGPSWIRLPSSIRTILSEGGTGVAIDGAGEVWAWGRAFDCCDGTISEVPSRLYPGTSWSSASVAHGLYAISARDSVVYEFLDTRDFTPAKVIVLAVPLP
ncbi:MAG: hypothetical protein ACM357_05650 [Gemmatimonadota bacterium]